MFYEARTGREQSNLFWGLVSPAGTAAGNNGKGPIKCSAACWIKYVWASNVPCRTTVVRRSLSAGSTGPGTRWPRVSSRDLECGVGARGGFIASRAPGASVLPYLARQGPGQGQVLLRRVPFRSGSVPINKQINKKVSFG